jgi:hypothetical protein
MEEDAFPAGKDNRRGMRDFQSMSSWSKGNKGRKRDFLHFSEEILVEPNHGTCCVKTLQQLFGWHMSVISATRREGRMISSSRLA